MLVELLDDSEVLANVNRGSFCVGGFRDVVHKRADDEDEKGVALS